MKFITPLSTLILATMVVAPSAAFATDYDYSKPSASTESTIEKQFSLFPSEAEWNND